MRYEVAKAKRFCEHLIPTIQQCRVRTGAYPNQPDPQWWEGQSVPRLIRPKDFYLRSGDAFLLRFRDPSVVGDNDWGLSSGATNWYTYDGY
jgi:hypothetical protein